MIRVALTLTLVACSASTRDSGSGTPTSGSGPVTVTASAASSEHVEAVMAVDWELSAPGTATLLWGADDSALDHASPPLTGTSGTLRALGLPARTNTYWRVVAEVDGQTVQSELGVFEVPEPARFPALDVQGASVMAEGYLMGAVSNGLGAPNAVTSIGIWRVSDGAPVWWRDLPEGWWTVSPSISMDGTELILDGYPQAGLFETAAVIAVALDGSSLHQDTLEAGHHAAVQTGPDRWAWIAASFHPDGPYDALTDRVLEGARGAPDPATTLWDLHSELGGVAPETCVHNQNPTPLVPGGNTRDWAHTNSLVYLPEQDALYAYSRYLDALWRIDRATGTVDWTLGGADSDFALPAGPLWSHAHLSEVWEGGALVFDNGDHYQPPVSSVVEVAWDEGAMEATEVWRYHPDPDRYVGVLGDARRLPEDRVLVVLTTEGLVQEVDRAGTVQWTASAPDDLQISRVRFLPSLPGVAR